MLLSPQAPCAVAGGALLSGLREGQQKGQNRTGGGWGGKQKPG